MELHGHDGSFVYCLVAEWDGQPQRALSGGEDGKLLLWDLDAAAGNSGCTVAAGDEGGPDRGCGLLHEFHGHGDCVSCLTVDWHLQRALSGSWDNTMRIWSLDSGTCLQELCGHTVGVVCAAVDWDYYSNSDPCPASEDNLTPKY